MGNSVIYCNNHLALGAQQTDAIGSTDVPSYSDHSYSDILAIVTKSRGPQMAFLIVNMHVYSDACLVTLWPSPSSVTIGGHICTAEVILITT